MLLPFGCLATLIIINSVYKQDKHGARHFNTMQPAFIPFFREEKLELPRARWNHTGVCTKGGGTPIEKACGLDRKTPGLLAAY